MLELNRSSSSQFPIPAMGLSSPTTWGMLDLPYHEKNKCARQFGNSEQNNERELKRG
jgi:hypothetical protein